MRGRGHQKICLPCWCLERQYSCDFFGEMLFFAYWVMGFLPAEYGWDIHIYRLGSREDYRCGQNFENKKLAKSYKYVLDCVAVVVI